MRRAELQIGQVLYYDPSTSWETGPVQVDREAVVVDARPHVTVENKIIVARRTATTIRVADRGNGVLVDVHTSEGLVRQVVPLPSLRGLFKTTATYILERQVRRDREQQANKIAADAERELINRLVDRALSEGFLSATFSRAFTGQKGVLLSASDFTVLFEQAHQHKS